MKRRCDRYHLSSLGSREREVYRKMKAALEANESSVEFGRYGLGCDDVGRIWMCVLMDNPMLYGYGPPIFWKDDEDIVRAMDIPYMYDPDTKDLLDSKVEDAIQDIYYSKVCGLTDPLDIEMVVHDHLASTCVWHLGEDGRIGETEQRCVLGALLYGRGVCSSISLATSLLLNAYGVRANCVTGRSEGGDHMWNIVNLGGDWCHLDVTFDMGTRSKHYFNLDDTRCSRDHVWEQPVECPSDEWFYENVARAKGWSRTETRIRFHKGRAVERILLIGTSVLGVRRMSDAKICKKCAENGKAGIAEPQPVPVAAPGPDGSVVTETVTVYVCERCGHQTQG